MPGCITFNDPILTLHDRPFVFVNRLFGDCVSNCVGSGDYYGVQVATQHLVDLGHQRIGFINGMEDWSLDSGYQRAQDLLAVAERPTAIFATNDIMALGAIYAIQDTGLLIPDDIAIVGYDDREFAAWTRPALTTIRMPSYEMGQAATRLLLMQFSGEELEDATQIPGKLIIRQSCGAKIRVAVS